MVLVVTSVYLGYHEMSVKIEDEVFDQMQAEYEGFDIVCSDCHNKRPSKYTTF